MEPQIVFYQLGQKIVDNRDSIPDNARQIIYYSLAIGHHVGVMDCFSAFMQIPVAGYVNWLARLPEGTGKRKLEGVLKWGEIEINRSHVGELVSVLNAGLPGMSALEAQWAHTLMQWLEKIVQEPAIYLMVRKLA
jgi:hypothetical protein